MDNGEPDRKRYWEEHQSQLRKSAEAAIAGQQQEPVVFLCDIRDSMARKIASHFIDDDQAKRAMLKYRKKRVVPIFISAISKDECVNKKIMDQISRAGPGFLKMKLNKGQVPAVLIASGAGIILAIRRDRLSLLLVLSSVGFFIMLLPVRFSRVHYLLAVALP